MKKRWHADDVTPILSLAPPGSTRSETVVKAPVSPYDTQTFVGYAASAISLLLASTASGLKATILRAAALPVRHRYLTASEYPTTANVSDTVNIQTPLFQRVLGTSYLK
jgi:hypothetical protein